MTAFEWFEKADADQLTDLLLAALSVRLGTPADEAVAIEQWRRNRTADISCEVEGGASGMFSLRIRVHAESVELFERTLPVLTRGSLSFAAGSLLTDFAWGDVLLARVGPDAKGVTEVVSVEMLADGSLLYRFFAIGPTIAIGIA
jgi:hypothetical protein